MTSFTIKMIAILSMLIDHIAVTLVSNHELYVIMRGIGRIAFPMFAFLLVEGYCHTSDVKRYLKRLVLFALISEIPYDLAFYHTIWYPKHQNVFITLALGLVTLYLIDREKQECEKKKQDPTRRIWLVITIVAVAAQFSMCDYQFGGVLTILMFYYWRGQKVKQLLGLLLIHGLMWGPGIQVCAVSAMIFLWFYNGQKGKSMKYFFYVFYPAHLTILYLIQCYR